MAFTSWKFKHIDSSGTETEIVEAFKPQITKSLGDGRDDFQFSVVNTSGKFDNFFNNNDQVITYRDVNTSPATSIVMNGTIQDATQTISDSQNLIRVKGSDYSDTVMTALVFVDATNLTVDAAITAVISSIRTINPNFPITEASSNPSTTSNGSSFPVVGQKYYYKPAIDVIEEVLSNQTTGDGIYYWFVNESNEFVFARRNENVTATFDASTDNHYSLKVSKDLKGVRNYIIIKGGTDPRGNAIQNRYFDVASMNKNGTKYDIISDRTTYAQDILGDDRLKAGVDNMSDATYPFTPTWTSDSFASFNTYVDGLRSHVKAYLRQKAKEYVEQRKYGKLVIKISLPPGKGWTLGNLISCVIPSISSAAKDLRVERIRLTPDEDTYTLSEDYGTL